MVDLRSRKAKSIGDHEDFTASDDNGILIWDGTLSRPIISTIKNITADRPNLITIMIAHRLSTVVHADHIFVLERGEISEEGTHTELLSRHGLYSALSREQAASA